MNRTDGRFGRVDSVLSPNRHSAPGLPNLFPHRPAASMVLAIFAMLSLMGVSACASPARPVLMESLSPTAVAEPATTEVATAAPVEISDVVEPVPVNCVPPRQWVAQLLNVLAFPEDLGQVEQLAALGEVGGVTVLGTPDASISDALARIDQASRIPVMAASDEEGGAVQRLAGLLGPLGPANTQVLRPADDVRAEFAAYGRGMRDLGFDVVFAPVADVGAGPGIGSRSFGSDPAVVTEYAGAVADGFTDAGIQPVFKHFPGHGRATGDSHLGLPTTPPWEEIAAVDLVPYETLLTRPNAAVMVGHLIVPGLEDNMPTSLSPATVSQLLRGTDGTSFDGRSFGFEGLVFVDALNMGAITDGFGTTEAVILALLAGSDVMILGSPNDAGPTIDAVLAAVDNGTLSWDRIDTSVQRVLAVKGQTDLVGCRN